MKIVNKHGRWWKGLESEWAVQDGTGNWWLYRNKKNKTSMKNTIIYFDLITLIYLFPSIF